MRLRLFAAAAIVTILIAGVFFARGGAASPQIFQALVENEVLRTVLVEFVRTNEEGAEEIYQTIKLSNAFVTEIRQYSSVSDKGIGKDLEDISFTFSRIEMSNLPGKTTADDDWMAARS